MTKEQWFEMVKYSFTYGMGFLMGMLVTMLVLVF